MGKPLRHMGQEPPAEAPGVSWVSPPRRRQTASSAGAGDLNRFSGMTVPGRGMDLAYSQEGPPFPQMDIGEAKKVRLLSKSEEQGGNRCCVSVPQVPSLDRAALGAGRTGRQGCPRGTGGGSAVPLPATLRQRPAQRLGAASPGRTTLRLCGCACALYSL